MINYSNINDYALLISRFNDRDNLAFEQVYRLLYNELYHFTRKICQDSSVIPNDVVHDIFIKIWEMKERKFENLNNLKAYIFIAIKNKFRNHIDHKKSIEKYNDNLKLDKYNFISEIVETETLSIINQAIDILPKECAKVFRLHLDGWQVKDIAIKLGKSERTVYIQKQESIFLIKKKLGNKKLLELLLILKIV